MRRGAAILTALALLAGAGSRAEASSLEPLEFAEIEGWARDGHALAFQVFLKSCAMIDAGTPALRPGVPAGEALAIACSKAFSVGKPDDRSARAFFEETFRPFRIGRGILTGYYEPEAFGSLTPTERFDTPLLGRPDDLVSMALGERLPGLPEPFQAARRKGEAFEPYPSRADIEDGALGPLARPLVYLERVDAFFVHIQGSTRVKLPDGAGLRLAFDGRNGRKFTGIGRLLVERGALTRGGASMASIRAWLAENLQEGRALMRQNASYIFFRSDEALTDADGPLGAQNVPLTPGRSIAVDRGLWSYGLPFWLDGRFPDGEPIRKLVVAQDTGSAILGAARGDYFAGTGEAAGAIAGGMKQRTGFVVLLPREASP